MKSDFRTILLATALLSFSCAAQTSSGKSGVDPLQAATKPLTPKSPIATGKTWVTAPTSIDTRRTNEELNRLERQNLSSTNPAASGKGKSSQNSKTSAVKPFGGSSATGSGINATYQKPHVPQK